jgi:hypothetical protein
MGSFAWPPSLNGEFGDQLLYCLSRQHPVTCPASELARITKWHVHLLVVHDQILTRAVHFSGLRSHSTTRAQGVANHQQAVGTRRQDEQRRRNSKC